MTPPAPRVERNGRNIRNLRGKMVSIAFTAAAAVYGAKAEDEAQSAHTTALLDFCAAFVTLSSPHGMLSCMVRLSHSGIHP